jgi:hypothetical protein
VAQVVEHLLGKCKALSSNPNQKTKVTRECWWSMNNIKSLTYTYTWKPPKTEWGEKKKKMKT